jgi:hypothetical protein
VAGAVLGIAKQKQKQKNKKTKKQKNKKTKKQKNKSKKTAKTKTAKQIIFFDNKTITWLKRPLGLKHKL